MKAALVFFAFVAGLAASPLAGAEPGMDVVTVAPLAEGGEKYTLSLQLLALMTVLTLLPAGLLMMTSFTRIIIVLSILRQALGTAQTPTTQTLIGLALFLTFFVMSPVLNRIYDEAVVPYLADEITPREAIERGSEPLRRFMLEQTREGDIGLFSDIAGEPLGDDLSRVPMSVLVPSFITSELKTGFQIGFIIFIPFLIIDLVVASVLMSMGMMMLSPMIISLPFKIMLFVLVDGWSLVLGTLASSYY